MSGRRCEMTGCGERATVVLADSTGDQLDVCADHHQNALRVSDGAVRGVGLVGLTPGRLPVDEAAARWRRSRGVRDAQPR